MIKSKFHGVLDYLSVIALAAAPSVINFTEDVAMFTYALAAIFLALSVLTRYELGVFKVVPFRLHGWLELIVSILLGIRAFYLDDIENEASRNFYFGFALVVFVVWLLTDFKSSPYARVVDNRSYEIGD